MKENNRGKDNHKLTLSIDRVLVEMAKQCLDVSISQFLEDQLRAYFRMDDEQTILDEIQTRENEINAYKERLCQLERERKLKPNLIGLWRRLWQALIGCMKD